MTNNIQGLMWGLMATALFAVVTAMAKVAVVDYHVLQILLFRQAVIFLSTLPDIAKAFPGALKTQMPVWHAARLIGAFIALSTSIWAVAVLPLTAAITLNFAKVLFVSLLALWVLREPVGPRRLIAVVVGFIGVIIAMRPGAEGVIDVNALIPLAGALGAAVAMISVRRLSQTETTATLLIYQSVFVGLAAAIPMYWVWVTPDLADFLFLTAMGVLATLAQWLGIKALRLGEASVLGNLEYTQLIWAAAIGYIVWTEVPDGYTLVGAAIIISASIYIFRRERAGR